MVLFLNKKKLQEQKPLVNNTYQGKYDYSQMQYLPEDQRFGFDTLVEVARDTNKKSLWDIFSKKPKMVFPVGEGMSEEETKKAKEILSKEDLAVKGYREGSFFTRPTAGFYDPMASGFMKDTEIALQTFFSPKSTREEKIESLDFLMQPIISASQPFESVSGKIPTTTPKGKIKSSVLKIFAKDKNPLSIERSLRQMGIDDINAKSLSFDLAKANTADEVGDALVAFSNKPLSIASKNVADDVASGVAKQATSISDDLAKLKPQTDDLLAEARKYKSAEEFVKAQHGDKFLEAIKNTNGAKLTESGFEIDISRFQKEAQHGMPSVRQGVFYLPEKNSPYKKYYSTGKYGYGGGDLIEGRTIFKNPIITEAGTGGKGIEKAYDVINGKGSYQKMRSDVLENVVGGYGKKEWQLIEDTQRILEKYTRIDEIDSYDIAYNIVNNSKEGNTLAYAIQENIAGQSIKNAGYDGSISFSKSGGKPRLSEVFDIRTKDYPELGQTDFSYEDFYKENKTKSQLTDIWNKAQGVDPLIQEAEILRGTKGMTADDIMATYPNIKLKRDIPATTISGVKTTIKEGEKLTPYELKGNKILLQDGKTYIVSKNQFQNIKGQSVVAEGKPFALELEGLEETVKGGKEEFGLIAGEPVKKNAPTEYSSYTLPGGENYKEILIKAPRNFDVPLPSYAKAVQGKNGKWFIEVDGIGKASGEYGTKEGAILGYNKGTMSDTAGTFKSPHWDEPNVISHLRLNERTYKGKKVTFMEELQSDWAREGRDKGFSKNLPKGTENDIEIKFVKSNVPEGHDPKNYPGYYEAFDKRTGDFLGRGGTKPDLMERALEEINLTKGIPYNPLLKNWQEPSIKRALKDAVDNNSDYFAWINGEQTSARYNLATYLENAKWDAGKTGVKKIELKPKTGEDIVLAVDKKGEILTSSQNQMIGKKLDEVLGKGLADKIMEKESGTLSGEGLKFGGEWASNLYDRQVKNIVEKLTGQKVEMIDMGLGTGKETPSFEIPKHGYAISYTKLTPENIEKGIKIRKTGIDGDEYIITDVLGDGKFKAVPKSSVESPYSDWKEMMKLNPQLENLKETFDISQKTTQQQAIKLTPEVKNKIKGIAPEIKTSGKMFEVKTEEIKSEIPKPAVIQGETFTLGTSKTTQPTLKERKLELKATQKEIKNAQIAQEKANKLERKEQKIREEAIANLQRFRGNTENIKADLEKRNLSQEDIDNIILEDGTKLNDAIKVKRNSDGSLSDVITKKEIDDLKASYTDEIPKNKWQKRSVLVDGKEVATNAIQSLELPYSYFERKGLSYIYDQVIKSGRDAELLKNSFIQKFKDNDLFKDGSWFTADRFNIDKKEARAVSEYYLGRQGKTKPVELSSLPEKSQKFIKIFDEIINETTQPFYQMASKMGKEPGVVENYAPLMTSEDIKLIDEGGAQDWLFRKHPAFSALKERVKKAPVEVYEKDYRKVATRWLEGMSQFLEMSETTNHLKYLINSDEFKNIVKDSDYAIISKWLKDITTPKTPDTLIKKTFTPLSQLTRKGVAMGALGLNYATVLKQALTQIPIAIIEKSLPKTSSEYAKAFGINVKDLPSISKRKGDIAIQDLQGKISRIFTGSITKFDKMNAQTALNGLLDKEYNKVLKEGVPITKETQNLIEKNAQDKIDMWFGGFFKGQRPEAYREELGNFILMFTYPLTSQANGFFRHILKAKGFKGNIKAVAEVLAAVVGIAYMEKVIENLSPQWSDEKEMTKDTLVSLSGNLPMVGDIVYSLVNDQDINLSPVIGNVNNIVRAISKGDGEKIFWTLAETVGLPKQVRRVKEGFQIMEDGGITDNNGKMLAPVEGAMEYIRAFLRGKYGPLASQDWIRNVGAKKEDKRWFVPEVEFIQNGDYERKAEIYKTFDRQKKKEFYNMLSEGQQKKLDNALKGITPKSEGRKSLSDIFK